MKVRAPATARRKADSEDAGAWGRPGYPSLVRSMRQQPLSGGRGAHKSPGTYKTEQNHIGEKGSREVSFVPIAPEMLESGMEAPFTVIGDRETPIPPRSPLAHVEFEVPHPFQDGNGRAGRMLITLMLWSAKAISAPHFHISKYSEDHRAEYLTRMWEVSAAGAWDEWCAFFLTAVEKQAIHNPRVAEEARALCEEMKTRFSGILASKWSLAALDYVFTFPAFLNSRFASRAGIAPQTAGRFTRLLPREGLIETVEEASGRRSAVYRFEPLMRLVRV